MGIMSDDSIYTDVFVCGGGPTGLLLAHGLARQGVRTYVAEKHTRKAQEAFGRAAMLVSRTLELLEREDIFDDIAQIAYFGRDMVTYKNGQLVPGRGWSSIYKASKLSFHSHHMNIRQKFSEDIFRRKFEEYGGQTRYEWMVTHYKVDKSLNDDHNITVKVKEGNDGKEVRIRCKYLVGADGGRSTVRGLSNIPMEGDQTAMKWVRVDGRFRTNMPSPDVGTASIETESHGNVLWARLDRDVYRIGFVLSKKLQERYGENITQEQVEFEAKEAMKPFTLEIERVDWMTCYGIAQRVAKNFFFNEHILLAGDACHTHSSGQAQGMNTGIHDATNLSWKLAGVIKNYYSASILQTYEDERRPSAQKLIEIDKQISQAFSGIVPPRFQQVAAETSADEALSIIFEESAQFAMGLAISYPKSKLNEPPQRKIMMTQGSRAPDVLLQKPGAYIKTRLYDVNKAPGKWTILIFTGNPSTTKLALAKLREELALENSFTKKFAHILELITIIPGDVPGAWYALDGPAFGRMLLDPDYTAHVNYGVAQESGAIVVVRPDAMLGFAADFAGVKDVNRYFEGVCAMGG